MSLKLPDVSTCCGFTSLESGVKIIGFSHIILSGAAIIVLVVEEINHYFYHKNTLDDYSRTFVYFTDIGVTLQFWFAIFLLEGIYKNKPYYLISWVILQITTIIVGGFMMIITFCALLGLHEPYNIKSIQMSADRLIMGIIFTLISCYTILIVHSHYKLMGMAKRDTT